MVLIEEGMTLEQESMREMEKRPWMLDSLIKNRVGHQALDVKIGRLPQNLTGFVSYIEGVRGFKILLYRHDKEEYAGFDQPVDVPLTFPGNFKLDVKVPISSYLDDEHSYYVSVPEGVILRRAPLPKYNIPRLFFHVTPPMTKQIPLVRRMLTNTRVITDLVQWSCKFFAIEDAACEKEIADAESEFPGLLSAYKALMSGSYKADLMRYLLLYRYGGTYTDSKAILRHSIDSEIFKELYSEDNGGCDFMITGLSMKLPEIALMSSRRQSPIMKKALELSIKNIQARSYEAVLGVTGNLVLASFLKNAVKNQERTKKSKGHVTWYDYLEEKICLIPLTFANENALYDGDLLWQRQAIPWIDWPSPPDAPYYRTMWGTRSVYADGNPSPTFVTYITNTKPGMIILASLVSFILLVGFGIICVNYGDGMGW